MSLLEIPQYVALEDDTLQKGAEWWFDHLILDGSTKFTDPNYKDMEKKVELLPAMLGLGQYKLKCIKLNESAKEIFVNHIVAYWKNHPYGIKHESLTGPIVSEYIEYHANVGPFEEALEKIGITENKDAALPLKTSMYIYAGYIIVNNHVIYENPNAPAELLKIWSQITKTMRVIIEDERYIITTYGRMSLNDHPLLSANTVLAHFGY